MNEIALLNRPPEVEQYQLPTINYYKYSAVTADLPKVKEKLVEMTAKRDLLLKQRGQAVEEQEAAKTQIGIYDKVQLLLQKTSDYARRQIKDRIESIVSEALNVVFGGDHRFIIDLGLKANQPIAEYWLNDGTTLTKLEKPDYDRGGGKIDIITLALRLAIGEMEHVDGPLFLDEIGKHVSKEYAPHVAYFLKEYSENFGRQIILITHNADLAEVGDVSLAVSRKANGESEVVSV